MDIESLGNKFPPFQRKHLNMDMIARILNIRGSKNVVLDEIRKLAEVEAFERGVVYDDALSDALRYYRLVNNISISHDISID